MKIVRAGYDQLVRAPTKTLAFTGAANLGQAGTAATVWTITGRVLLVYVTAFITETLVSTINLGTISFGTPTTVGMLVTASTIGAGTHPVNEWWHSASGQLGHGIDMPENAQGGANYLALSESLQVDCLTQDITDGTPVFDCYYMPLTAGASLT